MSPRTKAKKKSVPEEISPVISKAWDENEKTILLSALQKYGYTDIDNIAKHFPHKTKAAVRTMINKLHSIAKKTGIMKKNQIDAWLQSDHFTDTETMIPEALKYISLFENHPLPEESAGCDFKALYDLLYRATLGQPFIDSTRMTQETIFYVLNQVTEDVWPRYEKEVCQYIENLEQEKPCRVYGPKKRDT